MADDEKFDLSGELEDSNFGSGIDESAFDESGFDNSSPGLDEELNDSPNSGSDLESSVVDDAAEEIAGEVEQDDAIVAPKPKGGAKGILADFGIFDAMLLTSFLLICVASLLMFLSLGDYGGLTDAWRTSDITVK